MRGLLFRLWIFEWIVLKSRSCVNVYCVWFSVKKGTARRAANDRPYGYQKRHFESLAAVGIYRKYLG